MAGIAVTGETQIVVGEKGHRSRNHPIMDQAELFGKKRSYQVKKKARDWLGWTKGNDHL